MKEYGNLLNELVLLLTSIDDRVKCFKNKDRTLQMFKNKEVKVPLSLSHSLSLTHIHTHPSFSSELLEFSYAIQS